ncbi:hypothetical protein BACPEC_02166 [[Bacteroides] pectinophilus ATCC 43243]|uniref:Uncharacterized protein n=1 Tax=[Bacteroides] pectinophilus ATCC 43243 TaxID=483218 RepID=B7ASV8_9FIRM|nr:hypothetical protein BACPEC_02166 [[Bacteroides] pectinophilus ATCC 43243]
MNTSFTIMLLLLNCRILHPIFRKSHHPYIHTIYSMYANVNKKISLH